MQPSGQAGLDSCTWGGASGAGLLLTAELGDGHAHAREGGLDAIGRGRYLGPEYAIAGLQDCLPHTLFAGVRDSASQQ